MRYDTSDTFLSAAFAVIKQYDAATYARMQSANWHVTVMDWVTEYQTNGAFGATHSVGNTDSEAASAINADDITDWAQQHDVHVSMFAADVIVHEFRHIHQPERADDSAALEIPAFGESIRFARLLPRPDRGKLMRKSESTLRYVKRQEASQYV